jgi:hypothetical protein
MTDLDYKKLGLKCGIEIHAQPFSFRKKNAGEKEIVSLFRK